ncbi:MAG: septum formation initiator family protein [Erysipelotrichaceae bacterium]|nr:septum formation initiator family protein [Erysipelotrichaceae bacterium]
MAKKKRKIDYGKVRGLVYITISFILLASLVANYHSTVALQDKKLKETLAKKEKLEKEKEDLKTELELLNNPDYVTRYAREKYVFTREGETVIILPQVESEEEE